MKQIDITERPITPEEVRALRKDFIPSGIYKTINTMICEKFDGRSATLLQKDILERVCKNYPELTKEYIMEYHLLDIEPYYRNSGWKVEYDKPGYCESYPASFIFSIR